MTFKQRLKFYLVGFGIGALILASILSKKSCKGVNTQKVEELVYQKWEISEVMRCKLKCAGFVNDSLFLKDVKTCTVNYGESDVHEQPCGKYVLESSYQSANTYTLLVADCGSISKLIDVRTKNACPCK
ncbi:MAG TPA: hypothetical protein VF411_06160 [Bacteroidia bacterium]